jgi:hypothetical protein
VLFRIAPGKAWNKERHPAVVTEWIKDTTAQRIAAKASARKPARPRLTKVDVRSMVANVGGLRTAIRRGRAGRRQGQALRAAPAAAHLPGPKRTASEPRLNSVRTP